MQFLGLKEDFQRLLEIGGMSADSKSHEAISRCVKISVDGKVIYARSTSIEAESFASDSFGQIEGDGECVVSFQRVFEILKSFNSGSKISVSLKEISDQSSILEIKGEAAKFQISTLPINRFPSPFLSSDTPTVIPFKKEDLIYCLSRVQFATANSGDKTSLNGVYFHLEVDESGTFLKSVGTDGHRLSLVSRAVDELPKESHFKPAIIPKKNIPEVIKFLSSSSEEMIKLSFMSNYFSVTSGNSYFLAKLLDSAFPNYKNAIPECDQDSFILTSRTDLMSVINRSKPILLDEISKSIILSIEGNEISILAKNSDGDSLEESIKCNNKSKLQSIRIRCNPDFIRDAIKDLDSESVKLFIASPNSPCLIMGSDSNFQHVIMPMRI